MNEICHLVRLERDWDSATSNWGPGSVYVAIAGNVEGATFTCLSAPNPTRVRVQVDVRETNTSPDVAFMVFSDAELRNL